jgi:hypothetical protein
MARVGQHWKLLHIRTGESPANLQTPQVAKYRRLCELETPVGGL